MLMNSTPRQRKTAALLTQFFVFFIVSVAGVVSQDPTIIVAIILLIAAVVAVRLVVLLRYIWTIDKSKGWLQSTIVAFAISSLLGLGLAVEELMLGVFTFGLIGLISTTIHFLLWKVVKFFRDNSSSMPATPHKNHDTKDLPKEGKAYIARFDALFAEIPNFKKPPVSKQATHLREAYIQVHGVLAKNPELTHLAHELMDYHFPQALKLLENYGDFTKKRVKVDNVKQILDSIIQSFDALVVAVDVQLNNLYAGMVLDVKTDKAVLDNMRNK